MHVTHTIELNIPTIMQPAVETPAGLKQSYGLQYEAMFLFLHPALAAIYQLAMKRVQLESHLALSC